MAIPTTPETPTPTLSITGAEPDASETPASGSLIAYGHEGNIWLLNLETGETRWLTVGIPGQDPAWTADGSSVLFTVQGDSSSSIYTMPLDGGEAQPLVQGADPAMFPSVAPDGQIYYVRHVVRDDSSRWQVIRHNPTTDGQVVSTLESGLCAATGLQVSDTRWMVALGCGRGTAVMVGAVGGGEGVDLGQQLGTDAGRLYGGAWPRVAES